MASPSRVVFLNRFYAPDFAATAQMLSDLAEDLAVAGWDVWVIASQTTYDGQNEILPRSELRKGVHVARVGASRFGRAKLVGRALDYITYTVLACHALLRMPRPDTIVAMSDPPFILVAVVLCARLRGARAVYWVQDIYPGLAAKLGILKEGGLLFRMLYGLSTHLHKACDLVIALGPRMAQTMISAGASPDRTTYVHNWGDIEAIIPVPRADNPFLAEHGLSGKFVVLYSGNAGRGHTFSTTCEVMDRLRLNDRIVFVFIGGGAKFATIRSFAARAQLPNVLFLDYLPRNALRYSLSAADLALVTEGPAVTGLLVPSKTYGILASGRPIIFVGSAESDVAQIVRDANCGVLIAHDDADALEKTILHLARSPAECHRMGAASRHAAEELFSRTRSTQEWGAALAKLIR
jgi:colanic acid biosynthesis glycosyl transferase WcaI